MALLLLRNEADCLVPNMETESVSSHLPPELNRSPLPRERFRPLAICGRSGAALGGIANGPPRSGRGVTW